MNRYLFYISELYGFSIVRPLQEVIVGRGDEAAWFLEKPDRLAEYIRPLEKRLNTVAEVKAYNPCAVFVPGNVVPDFFPGIKVEIFHGFSVHKRSNRRGHFRIRNFFDLYCTQGPNTTHPFQELAREKGFFEVVETGWPKTDPLFVDTESIPTGKQRPVVLFASTFTPRLSAASRLFETIHYLSGKGKWKWLVNFHPKMDTKTVERYKYIQNENLEFIETDDIIPLLKRADLMVSDTSSVISEFLLLYKPVVTFKNRRPGPHLLDITDPAGLEETIAYGLTRPPKLMQAIRQYADRIHPYRDGCSSLRVLAATDRLVQKGRVHLKRKPINLIRRLRIRHRLGYYRIR